MLAALTYAAREEDEEESIAKQASVERKECSLGFFLTWRPTAKTLGRPAASKYFSFAAGGA